MFQNIKAWIRGIMHLFNNRSTIQSKVGVDIAVSNEMALNIDLWTQIYEDKAPWINNTTVFSANIGAGIASELARLVTIEFKSEISNNDFLNQEYQAVIDNIRNYTEYGIAKGGLVFKPYISNGHVEVDVVHADMFFPTAYNSRGDITGAILPETLIRGDYTYTRLEYHNLENEGYVIKNMAFKKQNYNQSRISMDSSLGQQIDLTEVEEWAGLQPETLIKNVDKPLFSYFKMPLANSVDSTSPLGVSIFSRLTNNILRKVDEQYSRIIWEYEGTELAIDIDADMLKKDEYGNTVTPVGKERLYRKLDIDSTATGTSQYNVFSPTIRDSSLYHGYNQLLKQVEFLTGLATGTISNQERGVTTDAKTATEIKAGKQKSYQTVADIQKSMQNALETLAYGMSVWGQLANLGVKSIDVEREISFSWDDSIIVDKETELAQMYLDVTSSIIKPVYYVMKRYGVTQKEAEEMMQNEPLIPPSPFDNVPK